MLSKLKKLGLTEGEAKVYLAMLKKGSNTVGPIVKESGVAYSNIYEILDRLAKKGLITYIKKEKTKYFQTTNPENLKIYLESKQKELDEQKEFLKKTLPEINKISKETSQDAEIFTGKRGLKSAYEIMLDGIKPKEEFLFFYNAPKYHDEEVDNFYINVSRKFKDAGVNLKGINHIKHKGSKGARLTLWTKNRYADFPIPPPIGICQNKIILVDWKQPTGFLIKSQELADTFKEYFNSIWKKAKP